ncbi:MAG: hypothetical protein O3A78_11865 [Nitrospinae bacterium]|jgi:hypothetical protein|nr:hypothetical protein [Nitrospinota bacterium]MDA1110483.1 hypothetical protein [Nitrospinota bacterium]
MDKGKQEDLDSKWKTIATKAVTDDEFKKKLVDKPVEIMIAHGLTLPEGASMKVGVGKIQTVVPHAKASDELKEEVKWWLWRLSSIREFGRDKPGKTVGHLSMSGQEADDDSSGMG